MLVAAWATTAMLAGTAHAGARDLDATFSGDGRQLVDIGALDQAAAIALAPDGKIVVAGTRPCARATVTRYRGCPPAP